jgi:2-phosphoglycerate kinase
VLVVGGASGVGKSTIAYRSAHELGIGICEVDDLHRAVLTMTTPDQQPVLHKWHTSPDAMAMSPTEIVDLHIAVCRTLIPAVRDVITQHVEDGRPIVLEGDYLVPEMLDACHGWNAEVLERVRAVFLYEPDTAQVARNLLSREPENGDQTGRAGVTQLFGEWLRDQCRGRAAVSLEARPYATASERLLAATH